MGWEGLGDQTLVKELCLLRLPEVFLRHCPCFPPLFGRSDGQIIAGEEMFGPREPSSALRLILQPCRLHKFRPLSGVHIAISRNSLGGEVSAGSTICQSSPLLPCSFPTALPQIDPSTRDLNYMFSLFFIFRIEY